MHIVMLPKGDIFAVTFSAVDYVPAKPGPRLTPGRLILGVVLTNALVGPRVSRRLSTCMRISALKRPMHELQGNVSFFVNAMLEM